MATHSYWRLYTVFSGFSYCSIEELEMRATVGGVNQCTGGTATAINSSGAQTPDLAFDGSLSTYWQSASTKTTWIAYEFATPVEVAEVAVNYLINTNIVSTIISWSDNGTDWTDAFTLTKTIHTAPTTWVTFEVAPRFAGTVADLETKNTTLFQYDFSTHFDIQGGDSISYDLLNEPAWLTINSDGLASGTPTSEALHTGISVVNTKTGGEVTSNTFDIDVLEGHGKHLYWQIDPIVVNNANLYIYEIEMMATVGGVDQCTGGVVTASGFYGGDSPVNAFDDSAATKWYTYDGSYWIVYEFAAQVEVAEISISSSGINSPQSFNLNYSDDGVTWKTVFYISGRTSATWPGSSTPIYFAVDPYFSGTIKDQDAQVDVEFKLDITPFFNPQGGDAISYDLQNEPAWMSVDSNGLISGTPTSEGLDSGITVSCTKLGGEVFSNTFNIDVISNIGAHEYWRVYVYSANNVNVQVTELEMLLEAEGTDQCTGGTPIASGGAAANAFDDSNGTFWLSVANNWIGYQFATQVDIFGFTLYEGTSLRMPKTFDFDYSNDGINWTTVFSISDEPARNSSYYYILPYLNELINDNYAQTDIEYKRDVTEFFFPHGGDIVSYDLLNAPAGFSIDNNGLITGTLTAAGANTGISVECTTLGGVLESNTFTINGTAAQGAHEYWRIFILEAHHTYIEIAKFKLRATSGGDDQTGSGIASGAVGSANPQNAFDDNPLTYWNALTAINSFLIYNFLDVVEVYEFLIGVPSSDRSPKSFEFQYSNDGINWTPVYAETEEPLWTQGEERVYTLEEPPPPPQVILIGCDGKV